MRTEILAALKEIERSKNIKILYACETGSRAWGFPSPDSDYDVRFIYLHELDWYLSIADKKDTIEPAIENDLDITGWDLRKSLQLLKKSNASLIERFQSPIKYIADDEDFIQKYKVLINHHYAPVAIFYHHYSLAKKFWGDLEHEDSFKLKSWFYLVRSMLSCNWLIQRKEVLPMHIEGLMELIDADIKQALRNLINFKATVGEAYLHKRDAQLDKWILQLWEYLEMYKNNLAGNSENYKAIDEFFINTLHAKADNRLG